VQERLFPSLQPPVAALEYAGMCRPASGVSGDYYDYFTLPSGCLALLVADVCGKGMPAALVAASVHACVRAHAPVAGRNSGELLAEVNRFLYENTSTERFVTMFYAVYDPSDRTLTWTNAGHCRPLWLHSPTQVTRLDSLIPPAGIVPEVPVLQQTIRLLPDDLLLVYSDGITEARSAQGEEFGEARLLELMRSRHSQPASSLCGAIIDAVKDFGAGPQADDLTVVAMKAIPWS
jgi:sigma-B regulation protein RsbU (phosphoserine phosphatase)